MSPRFDRRTPRRHHLAVVQRSLSWRKALCIGSSTGLGSIAQLGEHLPYKQRVTGSSPVGPISLVCNYRFADVAQLAEQLICNQQVIGSSPIIGFHQLSWKDGYGPLAQLVRATGS